MTAPLPVLDALSISQPWAWLIVAAAAAPARKRVENRQWGAAQLAQARARIGRRIAIHAAKSYDAHAAPGLAEYGIVVPARPALAQAREHTEATAAAMIWPVWQHPKDEQLAMIERWKESIR